MTKVIIDNEVTYTVEISNSAADVQIISGGAGTSLIEETAGSITTLRTVSSGDNLNITAADSNISVTLADDITVNTVTGDLFGAIDFNAKNTEGSTITKGTPVYISGHSGSHPEIGIAQNDDINKMPAFGIAAEDINNNNRGDIATFGEVTGFDTSAFAVGDELYISNSGTLTNIRPTATNQRVQKVAKVIRSHASQGILFLSGAGRTNDVPNVFDYNMFPSVDGFVQFGDPSFRWGAVHAVNVEATTVSGDLTGDVTGNLSSNTYITGDFIPSADLTYNLGSPTNQWHSAYVGPGSLYIEGQKVIGSTDGTINFTTDDDENMSIFAGGAGTEGTMTIGSAGLVTNIQDATVNLGPLGGAGTTYVRNTLNAPTLHNGPLELTGTLINQTTANQNLEIRTNGTGYLHANVAEMYVGPISGAVKIDENSITATAGTLTVTGNLTGDVTGNLTGDVTGDVTGNLTGDVTGNVTGNLTGNVTGNLTGDVTGDVTGNLTGNVTGDLTGHLLRSTTDTRSLEPVQNNTYTCGSAGRGWSAVYVGSTTKLEEGKLSTTANNQTITLEAEGSGYISLYGDSVNFGQTGGTGYLSISGSTGALTANGTYDKLILDDAVQINGSITASDDEVTVDDDLKITGDLHLDGDLNNGGSAVTVSDDLKVIGSASTKNTVIGDQTVAGIYDMHGIRVSADDTCWAGISLEEYVGGANKPGAPGFTNPTFGTEVIGGTPTAKEAVPAEKRLFILQALAANTAQGDIPTTANFRIKANTTEAQTPTNRGTQVTIDTIDNGSSTATESLVIHGNTVTINSSGDGILKSGGTLILDDTVEVTGTFDAKSTIINSTGNVQVNDNLDVTGSLTVDGAVTLGSSNTDSITVNGPMTCINGLVLTSMDTATANYLAGVLGIIDEGAIAYITDGDNGGKCIAVYDGSNWKRISFGSNISSS
jgi:hypothetical protein